MSVGYGFSMSMFRFIFIFKVFPCIWRVLEAYANTHVQICIGHECWAQGLKEKMKSQSNTNLNKDCLLDVVGWF